MHSKEYLDDLGESISISDFYSQLKEGVDSSTSQVNVYEYETYFRSFLDEGLDILHVTLSSGISGTLNSANIAAEVLREEYPERKIYIIDSLCASSGYGLLMDKAADLRDDGMTIDQLASWINDNKLKVNHWFFSTDLKHYIKGGRISKTAGLVAKALNICPLLRMNDTGHLVPVENIRTKKRVKQEIVKQMLTHAIDGLRYKDKCYISHSDCIEDAIDLAALIKNTFVNRTEKVLINDVGTVIGSHTGPGTTNQLRENAYTLNPEIQNNMMQLLSIRYQPFQKKEPIVVAHLAFLKDFPDVQKAVNHLMDIQKYVLQKQIQRMQLANEMNPHVKLQDKEVMTYVLELCTELATAVNVLETYCGKFEKEDSQYDFSQHKERALSYEQKAIFDNTRLFENFFLLQIIPLMVILS